MTCKHENFNADVEVNRLEDIKRFSADVRIMCVDCGARMVFLGLAAGLNLNGASCSLDATEARLSIVAEGETLYAIDGVKGFSITKSGDN